MKNFFFYLIIALAFTACNNNVAEQKEEAGQGQTETLAVDNLLHDIENLVGQEVVVMGTVDHVCKHGGTKMVVYTGVQENSIHIMATDKSGNFRADELLDEMVEIRGIVDEFRVDEDYIMEKEAKLEEMIADAGTEVIAAEECKNHTEEEHHKGNFPDNENTHKKKINGLKNQVEGLRADLEAAKVEGKDYLSFYSIKCNSYEIIDREEEEEEEEEIEDVE